MKPSWKTSLCVAAVFAVLVGVASWREMRRVAGSAQSQVSTRFLGLADSLALVGRVIAVSSKGNLKSGDDNIQNLLNQFILGESAIVDVLLFNRTGEPIATNSFSSEGLYLNRGLDGGRVLVPNEVTFETVQTGKFGVVAVGLHSSRGELILKKDLEIDDDKVGAIVLRIDQAKLLLPAQRQAIGSELHISRANPSTLGQCSGLGGLQSVFVCSGPLRPWFDPNLRHFFFSLLLVGVGFYIVAIFVTRLLVVPLKSILAALRSRAGGFPQPLRAEEFWGPMRHVAVLFNEYLDLQKQNSDLRVESERARVGQEIAAQVAHDIRSPISALNMALADPSSVSEDRRAIVVLAVKRVNEIANSLLKKSREDRYQNLTRSCPKAVVLKDLVSDTVEEKRIEIGARKEVEIGFLLESDCAAFIPAESQADIRRALSNLLNNSIEAIEGSGRIQVSFRAESERAVITVADNGVGMSEKVRTRLGIRGFSYRKRGKEMGTGLGLYHAYKTVGMLGGTIDVKSFEGAGTSVMLAIPVSNGPLMVQPD